MKACAAQRAEAIEAAGARASADRAAALAGLAQSVIGAATVQKLVADARARLRAAVTADVATFAQNPDDALAAEVSGTQLMDAGRVQFAEGTKLLIDMGKS